MTHSIEERPTPRRARLRRPAELSGFAAAVALAVMSLAGPARAQENASSESYDAAFEEITNSCTELGLRMKRATLRSTRSDAIIRIDIPGVPALTGELRRSGSFKAEGKKANVKGGGMEASFSATGRATGRSIQMVFVAEFYRDKKPLCTQSWDVAGARK